MRESIIRKPLPTEIEAIIKIWLDGNMQAHPFIQPDYWLNHTDYMRQVLPLSEVYVCEVKGEIAGFIGLDGDYIAGLFVSKQYQSLGVGTTLIEFIGKSSVSCPLKPSDSAPLKHSTMPP